MFAMIALATAVGGTAFAFADENSDAVKKAPDAVQATVKTLVGDHKIAEFSTETADGKTIYDLEYKIKGVSYAADIDPTGNIVEREVDVDLSVVPPAVLEAAKKAHADGKIGESSIITAGDQMFYGIDVKVGKDTHEMEIGAGGNVIKDAIEAPEAPETPKAPKAAEKEEKPD